MYPVYDTTKAAVHTFTVVLRSQLADTNVNVIELCPSYVNTALDAKFRDQAVAAQGGEEHAAKPMALKEYMDTTTAQLEEGGYK